MSQQRDAKGLKVAGDFAQGCASELDIELATTFPGPGVPRPWALPTSVPDGAPPEQWPSSEQQPVAPLVPQVLSPSALQAQCIRSYLRIGFAVAPRYTRLQIISLPSGTAEGAVSRLRMSAFVSGWGLV